MRLGEMRLGEMRLGEMRLGEMRLGELALNLAQVTEPIHTFQCILVSYSKLYLGSARHTVFRTIDTFWTPVIIILFQFASDATTPSVNPLIAAPTEN